MNQALHKKYLIDILIALYRDPFLAHNLYFKGGTAFYLFYGLPRFSMDLDFDLAFECKDRDSVFEKVRDIIRRFGNIKDERIKRDTIFFVLSYKTHEKLIKIEISARDFGHESFEIKNIFGIDIKLLVLDFLCAHKLVALTERIKSRDLFDAYFILLNDFPINKTIVKRRTGLELPAFLETVSKKVEKNFSSKNILQELGELIEPEKKNWVKNKLKTEVLRLLRKTH